MAKKTNFKSNGNEYFRVSRTIGHRADGTPIRKQFYGAGIKEANQKADEYMNNLKWDLLMIIKYIPLIHCYLNGYFR